MTQKTINLEDLKLNNTKTFIQAWYTALATALKGEEAYNQIEQRYISVYGEPKFSGWDSFRQTMYYYAAKDKRKRLTQKDTKK